MLTTITKRTHRNTSTYTLQFSKPRSISTGCIDRGKIAHVILKIKDDNLDNEKYGNYRPISNLAFWATLLKELLTTGSMNICLLSI